MESIYGGNKTELIKNNKEADIPNSVTMTKEYLLSKYGISLRLSMILQVIKDFLNTKEFDIIEERFCSNGPIEAYCIDRFIDWRKGDNVNFSDLYNELRKVYTFSRSESLRLEEINIEEKLWAFFLALSR